METVTTAIFDRFPTLRQFKIWVVLLVALFGYVGGLGFTTNVSMMTSIQRFGFSEGVPAGGMYLFSVST